MTSGASVAVHSAAGRHSSPARGGTVAQVVRYLGALALLGVGFDHIHQYSADYYSEIPTIGTLFALNFAAATVVGLGLMAPVGRLAGRWADAVLTLLAVGGVAIAAGSIAGVLIAENGGLFGFAEQGYREAIVISIALEAATVVLLGAFAVLSATRRPRTG
jgi:ABC-type dipeptide/oligopeptide/nickel transport system permease component